MPSPQPDNAGEIERVKAALNRRLEMFYRAMVLEAHKRIVMRTPVDTGRARGNWFIDVDPVDAEGVPDPSGSRVLAEAVAFTRKLTLEQQTWIVNNVEYIEVLENGGYPDPPKKVTGKTRGGFSVQAPSGMVKVTVAELHILLPKLLNQVRNADV